MGERGNQSAVGGDHLEDDGWPMRMMFWKVCGWARSGLSTSAKAQSVSNLDLGCFNLILLGLEKLD